MFRNVSIEELEKYIILLEKVKETEEAIQRLEIPFKSALDEMPIGVYISDYNRIPVYVNNLAYSYMKGLIDPTIHPEELSERFNLYVPGTDQVFPVEELPGARVLETKARVDLNAIEYRSEKTSILFSMSAYPIFQDNEIKYIVTVFWRVGRITI